MALVVEDGNGLPTANAYVSEEYVDAYCELRGVASWAAATTENKEIAIIKATDYIDTVFGPRFLGYKANETCPTPDYTVDQALEFPRVFNDHYELPVALPPQLQKACAEYAIRALENGTLLTDPEVQANGQTLSGASSKVGPIEESFTYVSGGAIEITQPYPAADLLLKKLVRPSGMAIRA
jgi:hypothetical protein